MIPRFANFIPLHQLWQGYMSELLQAQKLDSSSSSAAYAPNTAAMHGKLVKADYHGAYVKGPFSYLV
jgi:ribonuclease P protein subunit POP4